MRTYVLTSDFRKIIFLFCGAVAPFIPLSFEATTKSFNASGVYLRMMMGRLIRHAYRDSARGYGQ